MAKATKIRLLSFSTEDRPGLLAQVTGALAGAKVNITAICSYSWDNTAYVDMTVDDPVKAKRELGKLGFSVETEDAISVEMPNKIGELDKVARVLADAGINISYMYGTTSSGRTSTGIFSTSDNRAALRKLAK
ncbi:MAG: ACT domain-containing protein [Nitrospiraceae bacterium]|nr:ACT domain-containing protein [Nitrospiraceae bacterium]